jgi:hypothetical protein
MKGLQMPRRNNTGRVTLNAELEKFYTQFSDAASGAMTLAILPATTTRVATALGWTRTVNFELRDADGNVLEFINRTFAAVLAAATTSIAGAVSIPSANLVITNGRGSTVVTGTAAAWLANETNTVTCANLTVLGYTVTGGTSVETIVAP